MPDLILKADTFDKQSSKWRKGKDLQSVRDTHWLMPKYDGCHCIIDTTTLEVWTREWKPVRSMDEQARQVAEILGPGLFVQGEAWHPDMDFPAISGTFRRYEQSSLWFMAFNSLTRDEWLEGVSARPYILRYDALAPLGHQALGFALRASHYPERTYGDPAKHAKLWKDGGRHDGAILVDPNAGWQRGRSRNGELIKVKPNETYDLRCIDASVRTGEKTGRDVLVVAVTFNGVVVEVGSGVPHSLKREDVLGKIVEVECMGITPDGSLREPRFKGVRDDKETPDA